jgi:molecular chaperone HtpG
MATKAGPEVRGFETEAKQLLHLMIHSLYSNKEIFLRELISNASDAVDKLRFESLSNPKLNDGESDFEIKIDYDNAASTLTISDNGIGMNKKEVISNLGTIAKSGTAQFLESLTGDQQKDSQLIGQFGVGFYSSFIVADEVEVLTLRAGSKSNKAILWKSKGEADYSLEETTKESRGTSVTLHLKPEEKEFADGFRINSIIKKYADHISVPVKTIKAEPPVEGDEEEIKDREAEYETVNDANALWTRSRRQIKKAEYEEFYKHISNDFEVPQDWSHNRVEGKLEYTSLLYVPKRAPFDLWNRDAARGLKLYVQRVFIMDDAEQFLPLYLRFVKGVIDSNDISLNVSREILQKDPVVDSMRSALTKRALDLLIKLRSKKREKYDEFWDQFGQVLKEGPGEDFANREKVGKLLQFTTTKSDLKNQRDGLDEYIDGMKDGQDKIYYLVADSLKAAINSPHLEIFKKKDIEVILMYDRIDEWMMGHMQDYQGKEFQDISRGQLDLGKLEDQAENKDSEKTEKKFESLVARIKSLLGDRVKDVRITNRLTDSPACLAIDEDDMGAQMRKIMEASGQSVPDTKPIFEVNPEHPLVAKLDKESDEEMFEDVITVLFGQASLADGGGVDEPGDFSAKLNKLLLKLS